MSSESSRTMTGILNMSLAPELPELKEIDVYELSEPEPPSMVIAKP